MFVFGIRVSKRWNVEEAVANDVLKGCVEENPRTENLTKSSSLRIQELSTMYSKFGMGENIQLGSTATDKASQTVE